MSDETRVQQLLEELLESKYTPEEACRENPELLDEVRKRWEQMQRVGRQIEELFPSQGPTRLEAGTPLLNLE